MMVADTLSIALVRAARQMWRAPRDAWLRLRVVWWLALVSLLARLVSLPRAQQLVAGRVTRGHETHGPTPEQLAQAIDAILRLDLPFVRHGRCWKRALVLQRLLARQRIDCRINFGVRTAADGTLQGHAWLERDGQPFLEPATSANVSLSAIANLSEAAAASPILHGSHQLHQPADYVVTFSLPRAAMILDR